MKSSAELGGLPADFIARHKPDASGAITVGTDGGDVQPVLTFAKSEDLRRRLYMEWTNIGYPENIEPLNKIVATCAEIAHLLGSEHWAAYDMLGGMSGARRPLPTSSTASSRRPARRRDWRDPKRKRQDVPGATGVNAWENTYTPSWCARRATTSIRSRCASTSRSILSARASSTSRRNSTA